MKSTVIPERKVLSARVACLLLVVTGALLASGQTEPSSLTRAAVRFAVLFGVQSREDDWQCSAGRSVPGHYCRQRSNISIFIPSRSGKGQTFSDVGRRMNLENRVKSLGAAFADAELSGNAMAILRKWSPDLVWTLARRQPLGPDGQSLVFSSTWQGKSMPDVNQALFIVDRHTGKFVYARIEDDRRPAPGSDKIGKDRAIAIAAAVVKLPAGQAKAELGHFGYGGDPRRPGVDNGRHARLVPLNWKIQWTKLPAARVHVDAQTGEVLTAVGPATPGGTRPRP